MSKLPDHDHDAPTRRPRTRTTVAAAFVAALTGVAVAGTLAGAQEDAAPRSAGATAKTAAAAPKVRVLVKRGVRGRTGPRGRTGKPGRRGITGARGPAGRDATDVARSLSINWKGTFAGRDRATASVPGIGRLDITCNGSVQELVLTPARADVRTVATIDRFQSATAGHERRASGGEPIVVPLPVNGMLTGVFSIEPAGGDGGPGPAPASLTLSSERKLNADPADPADFNFCFIAAQTLQAGA